MQEVEELQKILGLLENQEKFMKFARDISAQLILRQIEISEEVRALNARLNSIDYTGKVIHKELMG